jgi:hypothetical protein
MAINETWMRDDNKTSYIRKQGDMILIKEEQVEDLTISESQTSDPELDEKLRVLNLSVEDLKILLDKMKPTS